MNQALKAELRKLFTVRSTYLLGLFAIVLVGIGSFYGSGFKAGSYGSSYLSDNALSTANPVSFFVSIIAVLLMAHEYRYNTIMYSLTLSNSRAKVLLAKILVVLGFSAVFMAFCFGLSTALAIAGAHAAGHNLANQDFNALLYLGKSVFYNSGFSLAALLITVLIRNITASIAFLFLVPNTIESLLRLLLKDNYVYLPFSALQQVISAPMNNHGSTVGSPAQGALTFLIYLVIGWIIAWWLFLRRDAV